MVCVPRMHVASEVGTGTPVPPPTNALWSAFRRSLAARVYMSPGPQPAGTAAGALTASRIS
jgi:hypothetical protein